MFRAGKKGETKNPLPAKGRGFPKMALKDEN